MPLHAAQKKTMTINISFAIGDLFKEIRTIVLSAICSNNATKPNPHRCPIKGAEVMVDVSRKFRVCVCTMCVKKCVRSFSISRQIKSQPNGQHQMRNKYETPHPAIVLYFTHTHTRLNLKAPDAHVSLSICEEMFSTRNTPI